MPVQCVQKIWFLSFLIYTFHNVQVNGAVRAKIKTYMREATDELEQEEKDRENDDNVLAAYEDTEAGFDLNENEMKKFHIWPSGVIPYYIDDYSYDKVLRDTIRAFLDHAGRLTSLRFVELLRPPEDNSRWVFFINRQGLMGCADHPFDSFSNDGVQKVVLGYDCLKTEYGLAEVILSLVGVPPQHNAPNRDDYIIIKRDNIMQEKLQLFNILRNDEWLFHELEYDFKSAGHYDSHRFTINGAATILAKDKSRYIDIGHGNCFSHNDLRKIKMLYSYISKQKSNGRLPDCKKLFSPGSNFKKFKPKTEKNVQPRKRPNKYLGLKDDEPDRLDDQPESQEGGNKNDSYVEDITRPNKSEEDGEQPANDYATDITTLSDDDENNNTEPSVFKQNNDDVDNNDEDTKNREKNKSQQLKRKKGKKERNSNQNLLDLSDYGSE